MKDRESCHLDSQRRLILDPKHINEWSIRDQCFVEVASVFDTMLSFCWLLSLQKAIAACKKKPGHAPIGA
jgi:hypothetical protein